MTEGPTIQAWVFALDQNGYVVSARPFSLVHEALDLAVMWQDDLGLPVRMLRPFVYRSRRAPSLPPTTVWANDPSIGFN